VAVTDDPGRERGLRRVHQLWRLHLGPRRERLLMAAFTFFLVFGAVRVLTLAIRSNVGPFRNVAVGGTHVHHLVWGILLLLVVGYLALIEVGTEASARPLTRRVTAAMYGVGAALTLDEFTLWLELKDNYWETTGQRNVELALIFGSALAVGLVAGPLLRALAQEGVQIAREILHLEREAIEEIEKLDREVVDRIEGRAGSAPR
jgi:hypothetical protein